MSLHTLVLAGALAVLAPVLAGCAEDDFDREAAYPQTIGVTNPRPSPAVQVAQSTTPAVQQPAQPPPPPPPPQGYDEDGAPIATAPPTTAASAATGDDYADTDPSALTDFRSTLDPYGTWVDDPTYGTVWVPANDVVGSDFSPYVTAGHWNYDDDYTWVSDYDWGWAPFHYGRWAYAAPYGWEWIPGRVYAGAWVSWRYGWGDWGYVGWAPLGPTWGWRGGVAVGLGFVGAAPYGFCATGDLFANHVGTRMAAGGQVATIGAHTQPWGTPANPTVNGHTPATPRVNGPPPQVLHIPQSAIAHGAMNNRGVMQAQAFAHASTAGIMGARPPQGQSFASRAPYASRVPSYGSRIPSYGSPATSHFGGRLGSGFRGDIASSRPTYGPTYGPTRPGWSGTSGARSGWSGYSGARSGYSGYSGARSGWTPSYGGMRGGWGGGGTTVGAAPGVHPSSPSHPSGESSGEGGYSGGNHGGGSHGGGGFTGGGFGGGGFGGGGFRGGGGGGGGRGGGGHR